LLARLLKRDSPKESNIARALRAVTEKDTPTTRSNLRDALRRQRLILPVPVIPDNLERDASGRLPRNARLEFLSFQDRGGPKFMAVFTNPEALKKWKSDIPTWIAVDTPSICRLAAASDYAELRINPGNDDYVKLGPNEIGMLADTEAGQ
ncbi:MAG TPA: SseB family protein, partial [Terriglobales bacterium]